MARELQKLNAATVKAANLEPEQNQARLADGGGLYLLLKRTKEGIGKYWRFDFKHQNKSDTLYIGTYPELSLKEARERHLAARALLDQNISPTAQKRRDKHKLSSDNTFEAVAREWWEKEQHSWKSEKHKQGVLRSLELNIFPYIGDRPIHEISTVEVLEVLKRIEKRGALDLLRQIRQRCSNVFIYGVASGRCDNNPVGGLEKALKKHKGKNHAALAASELPAFLNVLENYQGDYLTKKAIQLTLYTFLRTAEIRFAEWKEIDLEAALWTIPSHRMKMDNEHLVPLAPQVIQLLQEIKEFTGHSPFLFPQAATPYKVMSENTMLYALYRMGYRGQATIHGFRATASTILNEVGFQPDAIERQLAHTERNQVRKAYNRAGYVAERKKMMIWWANYLDSLKSNS